MKKVFVGVFCVVFLFGLVSTSFAIDQYFIDYEETQVNDLDYKDKTEPQISYPYIAWLDWRNDTDGEFRNGGGVDSLNRVDLYIRNLENNKEIKITTEKSKVEDFELTNEYVFWLDSGVEPGLHYYNLKNKNSGYSVQIPSYSNYTDMSGSHIAAWQDKVVYTTPGEIGIYYFDSATGLNEKIINDYVFGLDFEDGVVVYSNTASNDKTVAIYRIGSLAMSVISSNEAEPAQLFENIAYAKNKAVWLVGDKASTIKVYMYDLETKTGKFISQFEKYAYYPRIDDQYVVWQASNNSGYYLAVYDYINDQLKYYNSTNRKNVVSPDVSGSKIIFSSTATGINNIYMIDTDVIVESKPEPEPDFLLNPIYYFTPEDVEVGDLIKGEGPAVYYFGADHKRYVFPNDKCYFTWYKDFSSVKTVSPEDLSKIEIGGNVTYRPGEKMIKAQTSNKVYAVGQNGLRRWISSEEVAVSLYGENWNTMIDDVPDAFWVNYTAGDDITTDINFNTELIKNLSTTINADKELN